MIPELSVVIPVRDAATAIPAQLDALIAQEWDRSWEVVVADNGSTDGTSAVVQEYARRDARIRLVDASDRAGVAHCRNVGVRAARADSIAMCDADDVVRPGWVQAMGDALRDHQFVTGPLDIATLNPDWVLETRGHAIAEGPGQFLGSFEFAHSCNVGFRRELIEQLGGFDEDLVAGEDIELSARVAGAHVPLTYVEDAVVSYRYRDTLRGLWRQARTYGQVRPELLRRLTASGISVPDSGGQLRSWAYLVRRLGLLRSRAGRAKWVWVAGGNVGRLEGALRVPWVARVR
jgi:glycosyltransferase involved in cell wall biosynthesis